MADLSAIIVNYNSADYCLRCVESLRDQTFTVDGRPGTLEIIVLDNDSRPEDQARLRTLRGDDLTLVFTGENLGYGPANNQGVSLASGRYIYILNPDVKVLPGAVEAMLRVLEGRSDIAAVGPATWMDDECTLWHPPNDVPTLWYRTLQALANVARPFGRWNARIRARRAIHHWTLTEPTPVKLLSGASLIIPRAVIERMGLFDPGFPLYFEDTDWFTRARGFGYQLVHVPAARIVHYFSRSALQDYATAMDKARRAEAYFYRKHFGNRGVRWIERLNAWIARAIERRPEGYHLTPYEDLGRVGGPPTFAVKDHPGRLLGEIAGNPLFSLAAGTLVEGGAWRLSDSMWDQLWDGIYYCRLVEPDSLATRGCWCFQKNSQNRENVGNAL
jgi:GT2 family glycosyltransferase